MVDPDPGYRARRAADRSTPTGDQPAEAAPAGPGVEPVAPSSSPATADGPDQPAPPATPSGADDEDQSKPLYRDEPAPPDAEDTRSADEETRVARPVFRPRTRRVPEDEDSTTLLPRVGSGGRPVSEREEPLDDDLPHSLLGRRGRLALLVGALAAVIAVGLAIMYAVSTVGDPTADPGVVTPLPSSSASGPGSAAPTAADPAGVLADAALLDPTDRG